MLDKSKVRLFKMNDYDWVAAETKEQAQEWYLKETGFSEEDSPFGDIREEALSKCFLCPLSELTPEEKKMGFSLAERDGQYYAYLPFSYVLTTIGDPEEPFMAGSTEY